MAKTKSGRLYKTIKSMSYTRREYMGGVPGSRIQQFDVGQANGTFSIVAHLVAARPVQITHNALESSRIAANRVLTKGCGVTGYHLKVRPYPHEVIRENKQASGAGADRVSQGMRLAFGKAIGTAARVRAGQPIMTARVNAQHWPYLKDAFRKANMKLPVKTRLVVESGQDQIQLVLEGKIKVAKAVAAPKEEKPKEGEAAEGAEGAAAAEGAEAKAPEGGKPAAGGKPGAAGKGGKPAEGAKPAAGGKPGDAKAGGKPDGKPAGGEKKGGKK
ncbi:MAG: 50S ribosomal protein L16 [Thermoplasmatota archaeon]